MTVEVPLTRGLVALIDDIDADRVLAINWHAIPKRGTTDFYAVNGRGGSNPSAFGRRYLHRFILGVTSDQPVDHINSRGLDCTRANLRIASVDLNAFNRKSRMPSGYRGISRHGRGFRAQLHFCGRRFSSPVFTKEVDAALAYDELVRKHWGSVGRVNFPKEGEQAA